MSSTPLSTTALSRDGAATLARKRPSSFQMPTLSVSPGRPRRKTRTVGGDGGGVAVQQGVGDGFALPAR